MNESLQNKLSEVVGVNNISYILKDNINFSVTGYKVMQNQKCSGLLRCAKIMYNGKIKLVYIIEGNKPLSHVVPKLGANELNVVVFNLIQRFLDIKSNGFFKIENLELDFNKIFIDTSDYSVHFIYFPLSGSENGNISIFENEFRVALISLINSFPAFNAPQFQKLCSDLADGSLSLEVVLKKLQDYINGNNINQIKCDSNNKQHNHYSNEITPNNQSQQPTLTVMAINSPVQLVLKVDRPEYLIGKNSNMVNGVVGYNPAISRVHCKITFSQGKYYLTDLGSANGTYLNQIRLENQKTVEINNGDHLKLANSDFIISF